MRNVFISYAHSDMDQARRLVSALRTSNVTGWMDSADIAAGEAISSAVRDALRQSTAVIVLLSPRALQSEWVQFEIGAAEALNKRIIPVIVSGDQIEEQLPEILRNRSWIDARHRSSDDVVREVTRAVESIPD
ncbi:MAG TPA: toll/interleukin-1 receptor domain-containing protein [Bryobacteraceae bacterium]|nr:toll/interleukin-1 receptor domain-containing protein [Bryobacteraceae bacterium]